MRLRFAMVLMTAVMCSSISTPVLIRIERNDEAMGSTFSVVLYGSDTSELEAAADAAFDELHRLDRLLSNYRADSEWSAVNRTAARRPLEISAELFDLLSECLAYSRQSDGAFDITVGALMKVWGFSRGEGALPRPADVADALTRVGHRHVRLDPATRTIQFDRPGVELDPGGIGKGYAVDRMVAALRTRDVHTALVSAAGSTIYGLGAPPSEPSGWRITVRVPPDRSEPAQEIFLKDMSISTSGGYEKFFLADGRAYAHIIDPKTGYPAEGSVAVSVVAPRAIDSEAWTKPYYINGRAWTARHTPAAVRVFFCDDRCAWIEGGGEGSEPILAPTRPARQK